MVRNTILPLAIAPVMAATGFRFSKAWRHAPSGYKAIVYRLISTIRANNLADRLTAR